MVTAAELMADEVQPFRWTMGVKPLPLEDWLVWPDDPRVAAADAVEIEANLESGRGVFAVEGSEEAGREVLEAVAEHLSVEAPLGEEPPLLAARRLVHEDLCLLQRDSTWRLTATAVAAPTAWDIESKIGLSLDEVHSPVPRYRSDLSDRMKRFFDRLAPDRPVWRANRTVTPHPQLWIDVPTRGEVPDADITADNAGERLWLRVERQTLRRFPRRDSILFTIGVHRQRVDTLAAVPGALERLVEGIAAIPTDVGAYKASTVDHLDELRAWAAARSA